MSEISNITYKSLGFDADTCPDGWELYRFRGELEGQGIIGVAPISPRLAADEKALMTYIETALLYFAETSPLPRLEE